MFVELEYTTLKLSSSPDSNRGLLITSQTLLPLSHWDSGVGVEDIYMAYIPIDTDQFTDWNFIISTEVLYAVTSELVKQPLSIYSTVNLPI